MSIHQKILSKHKEGVPEEKVGEQSQVSHYLNST